MAVFAYQGTGITARNARVNSRRRPVPRRCASWRWIASSRCRWWPRPTRCVDKAGQRAAANPSESGAITGRIRLTRAQVILFTDELADFLHSGLQLEPALQLMENREEKSAVKDVSAYLREKVRDGIGFSEALRTASPNFDELYCNLVAAGEASGALAPLLRRQAKHLVAMQDLRSRVKLALIYPTVLVLAGIGAMAFS